ncbi:MurR/RpiR family transcriptional regulator [Arthrobacter sp. EpRS71]|uniref:MurR/RpiR family transcriptional regulator n=1 Tax=Arthrobacter sp. EpRS71 TaxID=1743141 RepID=UPI00074AF94E|nr:MurR/RpiR family transcriptional regulator [Arthrobacter sp. EpRS71]KUM36363.1 hypothetical protein AR689_20765 [Arthrobacter sp. EpRS71]
MSFRTVASGSTLSLSTSEERVMNVLMGESVASAPAAEVAKRANTHVSTVIRLAQKLGYKGYPELREDLRKDEEGVVQSATIMRGSTGHTLAEFLADEAKSITRLSQFVSQEDLDSVARTLHSSGIIYLFSNVDEHPPLNVLARRLRRLGMTTVILGPTAKDLAESFVPFDHTSTLIAMAMKEAPRQLPAIMAEAQRRGGRTVLISDTPGHQFRPAPHHLLAARRGDDLEYRTQLVPMALTYAIQLAIFHLDPEKYGAARDDIEDLIRLFGGTDEISLRS